MLKQFAIAGLFTSYTPTACAEICDKTRPAWSPDQGKVTIFSEIYYDITQPVTSAILALSIVAIVSGRKSLLIPAVILQSFLVFAEINHTFNWYLNFEDPVYSGAYQEGC